jgi:NAD(P)-dependent dehydrogenase (short-subunit alcohol dehydrogenase family)
MSDQTNAEEIVLVTGGSRGLGRHTALAAAQAGFNVIITYHSNKAAAEAVLGEVKTLGRKAAALSLDTSNISSFEDFTTRLKQQLRNIGGTGLYGLVNNAGIGLNASIETTSEEMFDQLINVHFKGVFFLTQKLLPLIEDGGRIVNISSGLARVSLPGFAAYGAAKGAVEVLTRYLAKELAQRRISANVVAPGGLETDFGGGALRDIPQVNEFIASQTALGRAGLPSDVGPVIAALLSESHRWINGQRIEVSGGWYL